MKRIVCLLLCTAISLAASGQNIELELIASGFSSPLDITNAGDDRLFIVERSGYIKIIDGSGSVLPEPFIDIDDLVRNSNNQDERGLLGLAFHPEYENNGYLFLNYIDNSNNTNIVRYEVDQDNPNLVNLESRELIMEIEQPFSNHNGGCLKFGADGYLYIGLGDGGAGNDPINAGQDKETLLGKMLRIDIDNGLPYSVPTDNPFVNDETILDEIWALGLRNPWRYSFDRETGDLWIGDVGQTAIEEIDFQSGDSEGGENYGWRCYEGTSFTSNTSIDDCQEAFVAPVFEIQQQGFGGPCSITGGFVYRGTKYVDLYGKYICADFCNGEFFVVERDENEVWTGSSIGAFPHAISTFGEDQNGELYIASFSSGEIFHIAGEETTSFTESEGIESVEIRPNPSDGRTFVDIKSKQSLNVELRLLDMKGNIVLQKSIQVEGDYSEMLNMENIPSGTYILNISTKSSLICKKLINY
ncbi:MAG: PQQ-dependent sugar dehydrogenase [Saprospiraceae bacterium]|nr:PQQ-dependent sugar dehydrogenase [Saprospiraceae bacterium]